MKRRGLLKGLAALPFATSGALSEARSVASVGGRIRPGDLAWPNASEWEALNHATGGKLLQPKTIWRTCAEAPGTPACVASESQGCAQPDRTRRQSRRYAGVGLARAWTPKASAYAIAARSTDDVVAGIDFVRRHNLRLVVKGGGHSYLGGSNAPDSLLFWTRAMNCIELHEAFVPRGSSFAPTPAVSVGAGCMWIDVYTAVTTQAGRYVQGGGCTTVGVAGLVLEGLWTRRREFDRSGDRYGGRRGPNGQRIERCRTFSGY